jgi:Tetracyclin repressor-like, C-terminal domain
MLNGLSNWFHPDGELSLPEVVDGYVDLIVGRMLGGRAWK